MDTPLNPEKGPRRRLKRVLKKAKVSAGFAHNTSQQLYQKKVKSAINVSLNLSSNVRTLQANNRSLAVKVEKLRQELRVALDMHTALLRKNQTLNERILELERLLDLSPSIIEHEVNSRYQAKVDGMQQKLNTLISNASTFSKVLGELKNQCIASPWKSTTLAPTTTSGLSPSLNSSLDADALGLIHSLNSTEFDGTADVVPDVSARNPENVEALNQGHIQEMSVLLEASALGDQIGHVLASSRELDEIEQSPPPKVISHVTSRMPKRKPVVRKPFVRLEAGDSNSNLLGDLGTKDADGDSPLPVTSGLVEQGMQPVPGVMAEAEASAKVSSETEESIKLAEMAQEGKDHVVANNSDLHNSDSSHPGFKEETSKRSTNVKRASNKCGLGKYKAKNFPIQTGKSPPLFIRNEFELMNSYKKRMEKMENMAANVTSGSTADNTPHASEYSNTERTTYLEQDMELTMAVSGNTQEATFPQELSMPQTSAQEKYEPSTKEPGQSRSRYRQGNEESGSDPDSHQEIASVPGAVTMHVSKGGKLLFAVGRKGADGSRPIVPAPVRARSKPKKYKAEQKAPTDETQEEAKTIFDFHDKTPKSFTQIQQNTLSVFSISGDESALSPLVPLSKLRLPNKSHDTVYSAEESEGSVESAVRNVFNRVDSPLDQSLRSRSRTRSRGRAMIKPVAERAKEEKNQSHQYNPSNEMSASPISESSLKNAGTVPENIASTFVGEAYSAPVKDSPEVKSKYRTRSQSRGRRGQSNNRQTSPTSAKKVRSKSVTSLRNAGQDNTSDSERLRSPDISKVKMKDTEHVDDMYERQTRESLQRQTPLQASPVEEKTAKTNTRERRSADASSRTRGRSRKKHIDDKDIGDFTYPSQKNQSDAFKEDELMQKINALEDLEIAHAPMDAGGTLVGHIYSAPIKGSPEDTTKFRTRSQSRGRKGQSNSRRNSPESPKKVRSKSFTSLRGEKELGYVGNPNGVAQPSTPDMNKTKMNYIEHPEAGSNNLASLAMCQPEKRKSEASQMRIRKSRSPGGGARVGKYQAMREVIDRHSRVNDVENLRGKEIKGPPNSNNKITHKWTADYSNDEVNRTPHCEQKDTSNPSAEGSNPIPIVGSTGHKSGKDTKKVTKSSCKSLSKAATIVHSSPKAHDLQTRERSDAKSEEEEPKLKRRLARHQGRSIHRDQTEGTGIVQSSHSRDTEEDVVSTAKSEFLPEEGKLERNPSKSEAEEHIAAPKSRSIGRGSSHLHPMQEKGEMEDKIEYSGIQKSPAHLSLNTRNRLSDKELNGGNISTKQDIGFQEKVPSSPADFEHSKKKQKKAMKSTAKKKKNSQVDPDGEKSAKQFAAKSDASTANEDFGTNVKEKLMHEEDTHLHGEASGIAESGEASSSMQNDIPTNKMPKISKIVKNSATLFNFKTDGESSSIPNQNDGRKRRAATNVSYVVPSLNCKMRRGDPFTSHYSKEKISIYKSPKTKAKEKAKLRRDVLGCLHNLAIKEQTDDPMAEHDQ